MEGVSEELRVRSREALLAAMTIKFPKNTELGKLVQVYEADLFTRLGSNAQAYVLEASGKCRQANPRAPDITVESKAVSKTVEVNPQTASSSPVRVPPPVPVPPPALVVEPVLSAAEMDACVNEFLPLVERYLKIGNAMKANSSQNPKFAEYMQKLQKYFERVETVRRVLTERTVKPRYVDEIRALCEKHVRPFIAQMEQRSKQSKAAAAAAVAAATNTVGPVPPPVVAHVPLPFVAPVLSPVVAPPVLPVLPQPVPPQVTAVQQQQQQQRQQQQHQQPVMAPPVPITRFPSVHVADAVELPFPVLEGWPTAASYDVDHLCVSAEKRPRLSFDGSKELHCEPVVVERLPPFHPRDVYDEFHNWQLQYPLFQATYVPGEFFEVSWSGILKARLGWNDGMLANLERFRVCVDIYKKVMSLAHANSALLTLGSQDCSDASRLVVVVAVALGPICYIGSQSGSLYVKRVHQQAHDFLLESLSKALLIK